MSKRIIRIGHLKALNAIEFCNNNYNFNDEDSVQYDYTYLDTIEPFGMLMVSSKIREMVDGNPNVVFESNNFKEKSYAAHMGFFQSTYLDFGNHPGEANGNDSYIPITELKIRELRKESYERTEVVQETIERKSRQLSIILARGNMKLSKYLTYSIRELMRNIVEHSNSESIWFAGQYWPTKDRVEIAILDEGVGIKQAISFNPNLKVNDDKDALLLAIEPGISGKAFMYKGRMRQQEESIWQNSGYGLYVTSSICQYGGDFLLCSGRSALIIKDNRYDIKDTNFRGTAIRMRLRVSKINQLSEELIDEIVRDGEMRARDNAGLSIISASKVSRMLTVQE